MTSIQETAYSRLKTAVRRRDLDTIYTPTWDEIALANRSTRTAVPRVCFLILLKTFQRLGYFVPLAEVPAPITKHIARAVGARLEPDDPRRYDASGTRRRHLLLIRAHLGVRPYDAGARRLLVAAMDAAARTKDDPADLVNVAIEELIRHRYELPAFGPLSRAARRVRGRVHRQLYRQITNRLTPAERDRLDALFIADLSLRQSPWQRLRADPGSPTLTHLAELVAHLDWVVGLHVASDALADIPAVKVKHFAAEARTLDAARLAALEPQKRYALAVALLTMQAARVRDDVAEMFVKRMQAIHRSAKEALDAYHLAHQRRTDGLVATLRDTVVAYQTDGDPDERLSALDRVLGDRAAAVLQECEAHLAHAGHNHLPFLWRYYKSHRAALFRLLAILPLRSSSQDTALEGAIAFVRAHEASRRDRLDTDDPDEHAQRSPSPSLDLSWVPDDWWPLVTGLRTRAGYPPSVDRRHLEVCLFSQVMAELKSGDLYVEGGDAYADYRDQLISWAEYERQVALYGEQIGRPIDAASFITHVRSWLAGVARATDASFPANRQVTIENGVPVIHRASKKTPPARVKTLATLVAERLDHVNILDVLADTEHWLNWTRYFGPLSGHDAKLDDPVARYLATTFCYGCNLGPTQAARSLANLERRQLSWVNQRHIAEEHLDRANTLVINAYNRFALPKCWGSGKRVSADGTKWDLYEQNLLSEYHIRYGGYGGIGYYHVSDTYIALFSHFIPCGVWEAVYILDGLLKNESDIQPDTIHADTQGQSAPVFGLAYLLGIDLMPRIRNWQHLTLYRPDKDERYDHIDTLFTDTIDWDLIATHLPDMLRVALPIKAGTITPSAILRRLGTYSRKNKLYQAFRELGRVVRTAFLLQYLGDADLRATIQAATTKSEAFNRFAKWAMFGSEGIITENDRTAQRKTIRYNHLVANCIIFYNVCAMTRVLHDLTQEGYAVDEEAVAALSPYQTEHINRFGRYHLDLGRTPAPIDYDTPILSRQRYSTR
jgi:TnpA family transposase